MLLNQGCNKYKNFNFEVDQIENSFCPSYDEAIKELKIIMKKICKKNRGKLIECEPNWYTCTIVVENKKDDQKEKYCYISLCDTRHGRDGYDDVLIRAMKHPNDGTGKTNNRCKVVTIEKAIRSIFEKGYWNSGNQGE